MSSEGESDGPRESSLHVNADVEPARRGDVGTRGRTTERARTASPDFDSLSLFTAEEESSPSSHVRHELRGADVSFARIVAPEPEAEKYWTEWPNDDGEAAPYTPSGRRRTESVAFDDFNPVHEAERDLRKRGIEQQEAEITRATTVLSVLEARIASLTAPGRVLDHAADTVADLERRANEATAQLQRAEQAKNMLEREVVSLQRQLQTLTTSALSTPEPAVRPESEAVANIATAAAPRPVAVVPTTARGASPRAGTNTGRRAAFAVAAVALLALYGALAIRSRAEPSRASARAGMVEEPATQSAASGSALSSRPLSFANLAVPNTVARMRALPGSIAAARPPVSPRSEPELRSALPARSAGMPGTTISVPGSVRPTTVAATSSPAPSAFIGRLRVDSVPSGAAVFVNQKHVGETPLQLEQLRAGSHVIWIEREGYERWSTAVLVSTSLQTHVSARLQPAQRR